MIAPELKLFVVGAYSPDPEEWDDDYTLVLAREESEAKKLAESEGQYIYENIRLRFPSLPKQPLTQQAPFLLPKLPPQEGRP